MQGEKEVRRNMRRINQQMRKKATSALTAAGLVFLGEAKERTPVDTGALKANNTVIVSASAVGGTADIVYSQDYAPYVHEMIENKHETGEAKFLENAMNDTATRQEAMRVMGRILSVDDLSKRVSVGPTETRRD